MDKRTLRKIAVTLQNGKSVETRIDGYKYIIYENDDVVSATPAGKGDVAKSTLPWDCYSYTHGGPIFRTAVEWCHEIAEYLAQFRAGVEQ